MTQPGAGHPSFTIRPHRAEDMQWVVRKHDELYAAEYGWDHTFGEMCQEIADAFLREFRPSHEAGWIAEKDGETVGSIFLVRRSDTVGQLRMLIVDPSARGLGIGARLVAECVGRARSVGYERMILWTVRSLDSARRLYEAEGFRLTSEEATHAWGHDHMSQEWGLTL